MKFRTNSKLIYLAIATSLLSLNLSASAEDIASAALKGDLEKVKAFVKSGADVNHVDENKSTPLINAVQSQNVKLVQFLLDKGALVNKGNSYDETPLMKTCEAPVFKENEVKFFKIATLLINKGANVNAKTDEGVSVLKYCIDYEAGKDVLKLLKSKGAK